MSNTKEIAYIRGKLYWAKVLGDPVPNYNKDGNEWIFDLALDKVAEKQAKAQKELTVKTKEHDSGLPFITLKQKELRASGEPNQPIRVLDSAGKPWPKDQKIGNGTEADVKIEIRDFGKGKYPGIYPKAIRILDYVEYSKQEFPDLEDDDEYAGKAFTLPMESYKQTDTEDRAFKQTFLGHTADDDLDDDVPMD